MDEIDPGEEFNVLDSDSSQSVAISRALAGENLVLKGPPGTGKSQTIANLICGAIGSGKREIRTVGAASYESDHAQLVRVRDALKLHAQELHRAHMPWDVSIYAAQMEVLERGRPQVAARLRGTDLQKVTAQRLEELVDSLRDLISLDGLSLRHRTSPWAEADVPIVEAVTQVKDDVECICGPLLATMERDLREAAAATGLPVPAKFADGERLIELWEAAEACAESFDAGIFDNGRSASRRA